MSVRGVVAAALGLFVVISVGYVVVDELTRPEPSGTTTEQFEGDRLVAYYFHGNRRCATCNSIENYTREALESRFAGELASGRVVWRTLNFEDPINASYREKYVLASSTLVLSDVRDGQERDSTELDEVWALVINKSAFQEYVEREVRAALESTP